MPNIFFFYGELSPTIIESQVLAHLQSMERVGVHFELWVFAPGKSAFRASNEMLNEYGDFGVKIRIFRSIRASWPFASLYSGLKLLFLLSKYHINRGNIHCRTEQSAVPAIIANFLRRRHRIIWDSRGDTIAEFFLHKKSFSHVRRMFAPYIMLLIKINLFVSARYADVAFFVSEALRDLYKHQVTTSETYVFPCMADVNVFYFSAELRKLHRSKLKILPTEKILLYCGSLAPWQCFLQTIDLVEHLISSESNYKLLIITPDIDKAQSLIKKIPSEKLLMFFAKLEEVNTYLNVADYAIILREKNAINYVASPVKFAEYCLAGLPIIMTEAVQQASEAAEFLGNKISYNFDGSCALPDLFSDIKREKVSKKASFLFSRKTMVEKYRRAYLGID